MRSVRARSAGPTRRLPLGAMLLCYETRMNYTRGGAREVNWEVTAAVPAVESIQDNLATTADTATSGTGAGTMTVGLV